MHLKGNKTQLCYWHLLCSDASFIKEKVIEDYFITLSCMLQMKMMNENMFFIVF
jgi:hypothetical protein